MKLETLLHLSKEQKKHYWNFFQYEKTLMDMEEDLTKDYEYYSNKLVALGPAHTTLDISIHSVYHSHLKNIKYLLKIMDDIKEYEPNNANMEERISSLLNK